MFSLRKRKIKSRYSIGSLLILLAFCFYIACSRDRDVKPQDGYIEKAGANERKTAKQEEKLRHLTVFEGKVVGIKDGDTFEILYDGQSEKVRLADIDCPEKQQPFGNNAKQYASDLCFGQTVKVTSTGKRDRYKRVVGTITTLEGTNVNEELVKAGLAWHYKKYSENDTLSFFEVQAKYQKIGLWKDKNPVAPWNWRKYKRETHQHKHKEQ